MKTHVYRTAAKSYVYPTVRLPQECLDLIGKEVDIFRQEVDGKAVVVLVVQPNPAIPQAINGNEDCGAERYLDVAKGDDCKALNVVSNRQTDHVNGSIGNAPLLIHRSGVRIPSGPLPFVFISAVEQPVAQLIDNTTMPKQSVKKVVIIDDGKPNGIVERYQLQGNGVAVRQEDEGELHYTDDDLWDWREQWDSTGTSHEHNGWIKFIAEYIHRCFKGHITADNLKRLSDGILKKYKPQSQNKMFVYTRNFIKFLARGSREKKAIAEMLLEVFVIPRSTKAGLRKMTERIISTTDIQNVLDRIEDDHKAGALTDYKYLQYTTLTLTAAYTGQRISNLCDIPIHQWRQALTDGYLHIRSDQDKIRLAHDCPLHEEIIPLLQQVIAYKEAHMEATDDDKLFNHEKISKYVRGKVMLERGKQPFMISDCRKFFQQKTTEVNMNRLYTSFIMSHDMSSTSARHYDAVRLESLIEEYESKLGSLKFRIDKNKLLSLS